MSESVPPRGDNPDHVQGERDSSPVTRVLSVQSRVSNVLALGLMCVLGLGSLTWYYANTLMRQGRAKQIAQSASTNHAQGDLPLPSLGRITPPLLPPPADEPPPLAARTLTEIPLSPDAASPLSVAPKPASYGTPPVKSPAELLLERQLSGNVFSAATLTSAPANSTPSPGSLGMGAMSPLGTTPGEATGNPREAGELGTLLRPRTTAAVHAQMLPAQRLLMPKGAFLDCTLETAIDSTLPGMTTCILATDSFGVDGKVVLLERGTKLIGETRGQVQQGAARIFVLWTEARTPTGVIVPLDSPGADELGRSGLPGEVNTHFWERFGAAMLISVIEGAVQAAVQNSSSGGTVVVNPSSSQDVLTEVLKSTINIQPTVVKRNGDRIQALVARNLDFRTVYELRSVAPRE